MFFDKEAQFDLKPDVFRLQNCVVDLRTNRIRFGKPSDMCSRASPVVIPQTWLTDSSSVDEASRGFRQSAWDIVWSMFSRDGDFHRYDGFDEVGDQDEANFHFLLMVMARLLEGRPLCRLVVFTNPRGRNNKGVLEKIFMSVWGTYYVPTRSTVFNSDKRNENEHSAAELHRRGARIAFANEVSTEPWSNAVFKGKNSSDPISARGCGAKDVVRIPRTETFVYGMNDPPTWEVPPKGSEKDRFVIIYTPNKFVNRGEPATSPRTKPKDTKLEERVAHHDFALGMLFVLLQIRQAVSDENKGLDDIIGEGTPTSRMWLKRWEEVWRGHVCADRAQGVQGEVEHEERTRILVKDVHRRYQGKSPVYQWVFEKDPEMDGTRKQRWNNLLRVLDTCGRYADSLMRVTTAVTRKQNSTNAIWMLKLDLGMYECLFGDDSMFGSLSAYEYLLPPEHAEEVDVPCIVDQPEDHRAQLYTLTSMFNLAALRRRHAEGAAVSAERRPDQLSALIERIVDEGEPVEVGAGHLAGVRASDFWAVKDNYVQIGGWGRAWQSKLSTQAITREARATGDGGMVVGEIDISCAFVQLLLAEVHALVGDEEVNKSFIHLLKYEQHTDVWKKQVATYYGIEEAEAKIIFTRFIMGGSLLPDAEWEPVHGRAGDEQPCLLQLLWEVRRAHTLLEARSDRYQHVLQLPRVQAAERSEMSALCVLLMDAETRVMRALLDIASGTGLKVLSVVFDGVYVLAHSVDHLDNAFNTVAAQAYESMGMRLALKDVAGRKMSRFDA